MRCVGAIAGLTYLLLANPVSAEEQRPPAPAASSKFTDRLEQVPGQSGAVGKAGVQPPDNTPPPPADFIGYAWMEADGTIGMYLISSGADGIINHGYLVYAPGDKDYSETLKHIGPMKPGEYRPVPRWPD